MVKIGVLGAGHLGKIHLKLLKQIPEFEVVGFYDPNQELAAKVENELGIKRFPLMDLLLDKVEAVDIVTPTLSHYECAIRAIKRGRHIFIEKPMTNTVEEARKLLSFVDEANIKAQVGHVERFNPAFLAIADMQLSPMFIETHRLAQFNPRGTDVSVILDLMVHDIDLILSIVKANVKKISASGVAIISKSPDIANARIEFDNGCVANITASRISVKQMRKMRMFQKDAYISMDFLEKKTQIFKLNTNIEANENMAFAIDTADSEKLYLNFEEPEIKPVNAIKMELELFAQSIINDTDPPVTVVDGYNAILVAHQILKKVEKTSLV